MAIRSTQNMVTAQFVRDTQRAYSEMAKSQRQLTSGMRIERTSDDPVATSMVLDLQKQLSNIDIYRTNVARSVDLNDTADAALANVGDTLHQIRTLAIQAANGTYSTEDLKGIADGVRELKEVIRDAANARFGEQYLFSGTATQTEPFPAGANTYEGSDTALTRRVGDTQTVQISAPGSDIFTDGTDSIFETLDTLINDIENGNLDQVRSGLDTLLDAQNRVLDQRSKIGSITMRLNTTLERLDLSYERIDSARSELSEADAFEAYMRFTQQQTMYQAALSSGTRMMQTTILNFI